MIPRYTQDPPPKSHWITFSDAQVVPVSTQDVSELCLAYVLCDLCGLNPYPFPPLHSHITLGSVDAVVQRLNGHPAYRETPLGENGFGGWGVKKGLVWVLGEGRAKQGPDQEASMRLAIVFFTYTSSPLERPKSAILEARFSPTSTFRAARSLWMNCKQGKKSGKRRMRAPSKGSGPSSSLHGHPGCFQEPFLLFLTH